MDSFKKGWFTEMGGFWSGQAISLKVKQTLYEGKSQYQNILVFESEAYGRVLVLDGIIQITERDEAAYQEMVAHLPLFLHPNPERVLVIGGGDGGVIREVAKHRGVKEIVLCEIDEEVINISKKFLPTISCGFLDERVKVVIEDGFKYLPSVPGQFDVIITDSTDPVGPGIALYQAKFYELCAAALRKGGVFSNQAENMLLHGDLIRDWRKTLMRWFMKVDYAYTWIPTYPAGSIGFLVAQKDVVHADKVPSREISPEMQKQMKYYTAAIHRSSFVLPRFAELKVYGEPEESAGEEHPVEGDADA